MTPDQAAELHRQLLAFQRKRGFIRRGYARASISMVQGEILSTIASGTADQVVGIANHLRVDKSSASRQVQHLYEKKLIKVIPKIDDKRFKEIRLTERGKARLLELDQLLSTIMDESLSALSPKEINLLAGYFRSLAMGLGVEAQALRATEHPVTQAILLVSRATAMYTPNFYGTSLSISQLQVMQVLEEDGGEVQLGVLREKIPFETSKLSRTITELEKQRAITRSSSSVDQRRQMVALNDRGRNLLQEHFTAVVGKITDALSPLSDNDSKELIQIMRKALSRSVVSEGLVIQSRIEVVPISSEQKRTEARAFLVENAVRLNFHYHLPERLMSGDSKCFGLMIDGQLKGVAEYLSGSSKAVNFQLAADIHSTELTDKFAENCRRLL